LFFSGNQKKIWKYKYEIDMKRENEIKEHGKETRERKKERNEQRKRVGSSFSSSFSSNIFRASMRENMLHLQSNERKKQQAVNMENQSSATGKQRLERILSGRISFNQVEE
jgi:ABC-type phosphate transport system ATPase subunit